MSSLKTRFCLSVLFILAAFSFSACRSCERQVSFDPNAPLETKWAIVSKWVPDTSSYIVLMDLKKLSETDFFKKVFLKNTDKVPPVLKGLNLESDAGIAVFTDELMFLGGRFVPEAVVKMVAEGLAADSAALSSEQYESKTIYTESSSGSSFAFLEGYLLCYGSSDNIKPLLDEKKAGNIVPPVVDTTHQIWGRTGGVKQLSSKMTGTTFYADIDKGMKVMALAKFPSSKEARSFAEEMEGIKTIKTIQSVDEPWLADVLDDVEIRHNEAGVDLTVAIDVPTARQMLKKVMK